MKQDETAFFEPSAEFIGTLVCVKGTVVGQSFSLGRAAFTIGRSSSASLPLEQEHGVSKDHARIELQIPGFILTDLGSRNGTFVNGKKIDTVKLSDGDEIQICGCVLRMSVPSGRAPQPATARRPATSPFSESIVEPPAPAVHRLESGQVSRGRAQPPAGRESSGPKVRPKGVVGLPDLATQASRVSSTKNAVVVPVAPSGPAGVTIEDVSEANEATEMVSPERAAALLGAVAPSVKSLPSASSPSPSPSAFDPDKTTIALTTDPRLQAPPRARGGVVAVSGGASIIVDDGAAVAAQPSASPSPLSSLASSAPANKSSIASPTTEQLRARLAVTSPSTSSLVPPAALPPAPPAEPPSPRLSLEVSASTSLGSRSAAPAKDTGKKVDATTSIVVKNAIAGLLLLAVIGGLAFVAPWQKQSSAGRKVALPPRSPVDMKIAFIQQWCPELPCAKPLATLANDDDVGGNAEAVAATDPCYRECLSLEE
jgi:hypothetical protein